MVEDYEPVRRAICSWLREQDFHVIESADGLEAIEKAIELQPDVVLFDIGLPKLNGIESAKQVRVLVPSARVVFVTQESSSELIQEAFRLGAEGYIDKQHAWTDLLPAIDAALGCRRFVSSTLDFIVDRDRECASYPRRMTRGRPRTSRSPRMHGTPARPVRHGLCGSRDNS
jgi:DNA-binding NarL/FixJ family response regulator